MVAGEGKKSEILGGPVEGVGAVGSIPQTTTHNNKQQHTTTNNNNTTNHNTTHNKTTHTTTQHHTQQHNNTQNKQTTHKTSSLRHRKNPSRHVKIARIQASMLEIPLNFIGSRTCTVGAPSARQFQEGRRHCPCSRARKQEAPLETPSLFHTLAQQGRFGTCFRVGQRTEERLRFWDHRPQTSTGRDQGAQPVQGTSVLSAVALRAGLLRPRWCDVARRLRGGC